MKVVSSELMACREALGIARKERDEAIARGCLLWETCDMLRSRLEVAFLVSDIQGQFLDDLNEKIKRRPSFVRSTNA